MSKSPKKLSRKLASWYLEINREGLPAALEDRLSFHGGFTVEFAAENTGYSLQTVRKHLDKLVTNNKAYTAVTPQGMHYKPVKLKSDAARQNVPGYINYGGGGGGYGSGPTPARCNHQFWGSPMDNALGRARTCSLCGASE